MAFQNWGRCCELLLTVLHSLVFGFCDLADALLCPVFRFLDWQLDSSVSRCACAGHPSAHGDDATHNSLEAWTAPSQTLYERRKKWGGRKATTGDEKSRIARVVGRWKAKTELSRNGVSKPEVEKRRRARATCWSDCACMTCTAWLTRENLLFVHADYQDFALRNGQDFDEAAAVHNVIFVHGFLSSSNFWVDTVLPLLSKEVRSSHRLFAVDVLGFGKSPRPDDSLYTNGEHVEMIRRSVLEQYGIRKFHLVGHSMGCTIALALAGRHEAAVESITVIAPLYFPTRPGVPPASYVLHSVAPQKIWPFFAFVHALMSWYEHLGRVVCLVFCKHHKFWIPVMIFIARRLGSRMPSSFIHDYMQHNHNSAFKICHNTICAGPFVVEHSMAALERAGRHVHVIHGEDDATCSIECGVALTRKFCNVTLARVPGADHVSIVVGREPELVQELEAQILGAKMEPNGS